MEIQITGVLALAIGLFFVFKGSSFAISAFIPSTLLATCAALVVPALGTATVQPAHLLLGFLTISIFMDRMALAPIVETLTFPREGFWLLATAIYGVAGAFLLPRLFAGAAQVNAIGAGQFGPSFIKVPLGPTSGNITQSIYFAGDVVCFIACYGFVRTAERMMIVVNAMLAYCVLNVVFAALDLITFWAGAGYLLDFIRNSTYVMHNEAVVYGLKRIVGSFTEASAFAYATIGCFGFTLRLWLAGMRPAMTLTLTLCSALLLILSTSTTAYVGLPLVLLYAFALSIKAALGGRVTPGGLAFLVFTPLLGVLLVILVLLNADAAAYIKSLLDVLVFDKTYSDSGLDRGSWNAAAMDAFNATWGLGAGIGSVRASSFALAVAANLGAIGAVCYGAFLCLMLFGKPKQKLNSRVDSVREAARTACIALLIAASLSGALIDLGLPFFVLAALACACGNLQSPRENFKQYLYRQNLLEESIRRRYPQITVRA